MFSVCFWKECYRFCKQWGQIWKTRQVSARFWIILQILTINDVFLGKIKFVMSLGLIMIFYVLLLKYISTIGMRKKPYVYLRLIDTYIFWKNNYRVKWPGHFRWKVWLLASRTNNKCEEENHDSLLDVLCFFFLFCQALQIYGPSSMKKENCMPNENLNSIPNGEKHTF